ncbi:MAG: hypothetical protein MUF58_19730 [Arcicella sp.]|jgi:predicted helicase|nr:hypothetical protein [Arcicella sp.]
MKNEPALAQVFHFDLYGKREAKYDFLDQNSLKSIEWNILTPQEPNFFLVKKDFDESGLYEMGFKIDELFKVNACGVVSARDSLLISMDKIHIENVKKDFLTLDEQSFIQKYNLPEDSRDWKYSFALNTIKEKIFSYEKINYKPFDIRHILYSPKSKGIISYPRFEVMKHFINHQNLGLILNKQFVGDTYSHCSITTSITVKGCHYLGNNGNDFLFPLYLYPESQDLFSTTERTPNLNPEVLKRVEEFIGIPFVAEKTPQSAIKNPQSFAPIDVLDYIYAVLHSPTYREKYKEFLKIDFPRVPFPKDLATFWKLVKLGGEIRQIHLLESPEVENYITEYPENGDNVVVKIKYEEGRVYINENQYFDKVPETAWNFYIGGYQPAQKWLKDRKERELSFEDILHYQKIIVALTETARIMAEIDLVGVE